MRPYFVVMAVVLMAVAAFGQQPYPRPTDGLCFYGCGPYIPLVATPEISLQTVSPNPVGASNATTGLIAGATNSTLSQIQGSTSSEYTAPVWYQGGAPLTTSQVSLETERIGREGRIMREGMMRNAMREEGRPREERGEHAVSRGIWAFFAGEESAPDFGQAAVAARGNKKATRTLTNEDVQRENEKNGTVKYDGKTGKI